jgi:type II secretory pathway pseudopilin PulG
VSAPAENETRPRSRLSTLAGRVRDPGAFGLVELLIALMVLNIGIFATVAAFNGGALALRRSSHVSAATALADKQMEAFRDSTYGGITSIPATNLTGPDARRYQLAATVTPGSQKTGVTYTGSTSVKLVTLTVRDVADGNRLLVTSSSTFDQCTQDRTSPACGG